MKQTQMILSLLVILSIPSTWARECGWYKMNVGDQKLILEEKIQFKADWSGGINSYHFAIDFIIPNVEFIDAAAGYYDFRTYADGMGIVDRVDFVEGYSLDQNPVRYDVIPGKQNPLGELYAPHRLETRAWVYEDEIHYLYDTLTSPKSVLDTRGEVCLTKLKDEEKVFFSFKVHFVGNPEVGFDTPKLSQTDRENIWKSAAAATIKRLSRPISDDIKQNFQRALLGPYKHENQ